MPGHKDQERRVLALRRAAEKFGDGEGRSGASGAAGLSPSVSTGAAASSEDPRTSSKLSPEPPEAKDPSSFGFAVKKALFETAQTQSVEVQKKPLLELREVFRALPAGAVRSKRLVFDKDVSPTAVKELNARLTAAEDLEKELQNGTVRQEGEALKAAYLEGDEVRWATFIRLNEDGEPVQTIIPESDVKSMDGNSEPQLSALLRSRRFPFSTYGWPILPVVSGVSSTEVRGVLIACATPASYARI